MNLNFSDKCLEIEDSPVSTKKLKLDLTQEPINDEVIGSGKSKILNEQCTENFEIINKSFNFND